jgi:hypothetical protein
MKVGKGKPGIMHYTATKFTDGILGTAACNSDRIIRIVEPGINGTRYRRKVTCKGCRRSEAFNKK